MKIVRLSKEEQETIINMNESSVDLCIYTSSPSMMKKLSKMSKPTRTYKNNDGESVVAMEFILPLEYISIRKPPKTARQKPVSDKELENLSKSSKRMVG